MTAPYTVERVVFASGERFPLLREGPLRVPSFDVTAFTLSEFRQVNLASATLERVVRSIKGFALFCDKETLDLDARMREGRFLEMGEVDALVEWCGRALADMEAIVEAEHEPRPSRKTNVHSLESRRARAKKSAKAVDRDTAAARLRYIASFLSWKADRYLLNLSTKSPTRAALVSAKDTVIAALRARVPDASGRNSTQQRMALEEALQERLWEVIRPGTPENPNPENPWKTYRTQVRNELIIRWFIGLGLRRGELLGARVADVDLRQNQVFIARRPDDVEDPRVDEPNTKTNDRLVVMAPRLAERTRHYIMEVRRSYPRARKHPFLFVASGGAPLSKSGLYAVFEELCDRHPELGPIFPHLLRHTWNFNFSVLIDETGESPEYEKKMRSRLMGWNPTSKTGDIYNGRHTERKARRASLQMQENMELPADVDED
jgi:integrase